MGQNEAERARCARQQKKERKKERKLSRQKVERGRRTNETSSPCPFPLLSFFFFFFFGVCASV